MSKKSKKQMTYTILLITAIISQSCNESNEKGITVSDISVVNTDKIETKVESISAIETVKIGSQEWMKEDMAKTTYNNGDFIHEAKSDLQWVNYCKKKEGCFKRLKNGGILYNGYALLDKRGITPKDFKIPSIKDFSSLFELLGGGDSQSGRATKAMATYPIYVEDWVGDQETGGLESIEVKSNGKSGFNAKKGGFVYDSGSSGESDNCSFWWTSSKEGADYFVFDIGYCSQDMGGGIAKYPLTFGFSLRLIKI